MPNKDGKGPLSTGVNLGRGRGFRVENQETEGAGINPTRRSGGRFGRGRGGQGRGQGRGLGLKRRAESTPSEGNCICPSCGVKVKHKIGHPCFEQQCPHCDIPMDRE